jgi:DNA-binding LytR/AlgR family response regulator
MINCIIIEDELLAQEILKKYIDQSEHLSLVSSFQLLDEALKFLEKNVVDLVFLDLNLPDGFGFELIKEIKGNPEFIITTAYSEFALESYDLNVTDYLMKPITKERFDQSIAKISTVAPEFIMVNSEHQKVKIWFKDILFIESIDKYIRFVLKDKKVMSLNSIQAISKEIPTFFYQIHRSYLINIECIDLVKNDMVIIKEYEIPISKRRKKGFLDFID